MHTNNKLRIGKKIHDKKNQTGILNIKIQKQDKQAAIHHQINKNKYIKLATNTLFINYNPFKILNTMLYNIVLQLHNIV